MILFDRYEVLEQFTSAANGTIFKCSYGGRKYFLKRYKDVMYASANDSEALKEDKKKKTDPWLKSRKTLCERLRKARCGDGTGNIVYPQEFLVDYEKGPIYALNNWIEIEELSLEEIAKLPEESKLFIMQIAASSLGLIHSCKIIHNDLKPDNIPVSWNSDKTKLIPKITDLDDSQLEGEISFIDKQAEVLRTTPEYESPEMCQLKMTDDETKFNAMVGMITTSSDIFSLGIIFHEWYSGKKPKICDSSVMRIKVFDYFPETDSPADGRIALGLDENMPEWLADLITDMLSPGDLFGYSRRPTATEVFEAIKSRQWQPLYPKKAAVAQSEASKLLGEIAGGKFGHLEGIAEYDELHIKISNDLAAATKEYEENDEKLKLLKAIIDSCNAKYMRAIDLIAEKLGVLSALDKAEFKDENAVEKMQRKFAGVESKDLQGVQYSLILAKVNEIETFLTSAERKPAETDSRKELRSLVKFIIRLKADMFEERSQILELQRIFLQKNLDEYGVITVMEENEVEDMLEVINSSLSGVNMKYQVKKPVKENYDSIKIDSFGNIFATPKGMHERNVALSQALLWGLIEENSKR